jgi:hypothetical protein
VVAPTVQSLNFDVPDSSPVSVNEKNISAGKFFHREFSFLKAILFLSILVSSERRLVRHTYTTQLRGDVEMYCRSVLVSMATKLHSRLYEEKIFSYLKTEQYRW